MPLTEPVLASNPTAASSKPPLRLEVALAPQWAPTGRPAAATALAPQSDTVYIVVDVIRATTSLCMLFERGCAEVLAAPDVEAVRALRPALGSALLLAGEVGGARPDGFDYGNSPAELSRAPVAGRTVLFATTNGTRAIRACSGRTVLAGALRNAQAVAAAALAAVPIRDAVSGAPAVDSDSAEDGRFDIVIVCSGRSGLPAYDDTICAGYILRCVTEAATGRGQPVALESGARIALAAMLGAEATGGVRAALAESGAYQNIADLGLADDLDWCAATDVTTVVPRVMGDYPGHDLIVMRASGDTGEGQT